MIISLFKSKSWTSPFASSWLIFFRYSKLFDINFRLLSVITVPLLLPLYIFPFSVISKSVTSKINSSAKSWLILHMVNMIIRKKKKNLTVRRLHFVRFTCCTCTVICNGENEAIGIPRQSVLEVKWANWQFYWKEMRLHMLHNAGPWCTMYA